MLDNALLSYQHKGLGLLRALAIACTCICGPGRVRGSLVQLRALLAVLNTNVAGLAFANLLFAIALPRLGNIGPRDACLPLSSISNDAGDIRNGKGLG